jgi:2-oxoglutarate ferredoxin oxidoreductase subunit gamma
LNQESCDKYYKDIKKNGYLLVDSDLVKRYPSGGFKSIGLPFTNTAVIKAGKAMFTNVVALGAVVGLTGVIRKESLVKALLARVPKGTEEANRKALMAGFELISSKGK